MAQNLFYYLCGFQSDSSWLLVLSAATHEPFFNPHYPYFNFQELRVRVQDGYAAWSFRKIKMK
jgi:hypothetical protein